MFDCIVVGAGFAGAVISRELAEKAGKKVLILEKRDHIGGNMYDHYDAAGVLVHQYGPHIFHTNSTDVFDYLSRFTKWNQYEHEVVGSIDGKLVPIPFNLNTLSEVFDTETAERLKDILVSKYGIGSKFPILKLREDENPGIREIADYVYSKIFVNYTIKQWDLKPEEIDPSVTSRVPVLISYDNRYFQDTYQGLPLDGYTALFEKLLDHPSIEIKLNVDATALIKIDVENKKVIYEGIPFNGPVIYTGALDDLLEYRYGMLPYRSLEFAFETHLLDSYQPKGTVNYPNEELYTRITEFKHMTEQKIVGKTSIVKEYPMPYDRHAPKGNIPFYTVFTDENIALYQKYRMLVADIKNLFVLGRLAEYKYYNMDAIVERSLLVFSQDLKDFV